MQGPVYGLRTDETDINELLMPNFHYDDIFGTVVNRFLVQAVVRSGRRIIGFDLVEVAPGPDGDEWDGNVGARLLYKLIGTALQSGPNPRT